MIPSAPRASATALRLSAIALLASAVVTACGGNPSGPSGGSQVVLRGTVLGSNASVSTASASTTVGMHGSTAAAAAAVITVTVQEDPTITATVGPDGTFTLRGLPPGTFTLVFTSNGAPLGTLAFAEVAPNQEITITVAVSGTTVTLVEQKRNGVGHGDVELEGKVSAILLTTPAESRFTIAGRTVVVRPGQTTIRREDTALTVADVIVGVQVHVKGTFLPPEGDTQPVLALEIKLQDQGSNGPGGPGGPPPNRPSGCMIAGGIVGSPIELQGNIASGTAASFMMNVGGNRATGPVQINAGSASFKCNGKDKLTGDLCKATATAGTQVHVKGVLTSCDLATALTTASEVQIQK